MAKIVMVFIFVCSCACFSGLRVEAGDSSLDISDAFSTSTEQVAPSGVSAAFNRSSDAVYVPSEGGGAEQAPAATANFEANEVSVSVDTQYHWVEGSHSDAGAFLTPEQFESIQGTITGVLDNYSGFLAKPNTIYVKDYGEDTLWSEAHEIGRTGSTVELDIDKFLREGDKDAASQYVLSNLAKYAWEHDTTDNLKREWMIDIKGFSSSETADILKNKDSNFDTLQDIRGEWADEFSKYYQVGSWADTDRVNYLTTNEAKFMYNNLFKAGENVRVFKVDKATGAIAHAEVPLIKYEDRTKKDNTLLGEYQIPDFSNAQWAY